MTALPTAIEQIYRLNVGIVGRGAVRHERPHKPVLLLTVLELIDAGDAHPDRIEWSHKLRRNFAAKFALVRKADDEPTPENPFHFLRGDGFWQTYSISPGGAEHAFERKPLVGDCDRGRVFARFTGPWSALAVDQHSRKLLRDAIISRYFPAQRATLVRQAEFVEEVENLASPRSAAFRRVLLDIYDHQCSACGLRVRIPDLGFTLVDAAHLIPFSTSGDDRPANGICLCKNHHWAMDQHLIAPSPDLKWVVSPRLDSRRSQGEAELLTLAGKRMLVPADEAYQPLREALDWRASRLR